MQICFCRDQIFKRKRYFLRIYMEKQRRMIS